jgi:hypothetical protein
MFALLELRDFISVAAGVLSLLSLMLAFRVQRRTRSLSLYSDIDRLYFELLKLAMAHPNFVNPEYTNDYEHSFSPEDRPVYELYAFCAWNICETIVDREDDPLTYESWRPVLALESTLHWKWFENDLNRKRFKASFRKYMSENHDQLREFATRELSS